MKLRYYLYAGFFALACGMGACGADGNPGQETGGGGYDLAGGAGGDSGNGGFGGTGGKHGPTTNPNDSGGEGGGTTTTSSATAMTGGGGTGGIPTGTGGTTDGGTGGNGPQCADAGVPQVLYMSSDDSSSMGSPAIAREYLSLKMLPPKELIRTWEFLNYYRVRYPLPDDDALAVHAHFAPGNEGEYRLQIGVQAFQPKRPTMALTFVLDTSGSLVGEGIAREREAVRAIAAQLTTGDHVNFVTWANGGEVILQDHVISGPNDPALLAATNDLAPGGGSDLHAGLTRGYELAELTVADNRLSRVVLMSDGGANIGVIDKDAIALQAKHGDDQGIYLVGVGLGPALAYSDDLMNTVTDAGRGAYVYLDRVGQGDDKGEAAELLGDRFDEVMDVAARSVQVQVTLPSYFTFKEFNGEGKSSEQTKVPPQHLAPGDSMIFDQVLTVASGDTLCMEDSIHVNVTWQNPLIHLDEGSGTGTTWEAQLKDIEGETWQLLKTEAIVRYAGFLASPSKPNYDRATAALDKALTNPAVTDDPYWTELDEIEKLLLAIPETAYAP